MSNTGSTDPSIPITLTTGQWRQIAAVIDSLPTTTTDPDGLEQLCHELAARGLFDHLPAA